MLAEASGKVADGMADDPQGHHDDGEFGPTYKSLFLGTCLIIGSAFGWWFTNFISAFDALLTRVAALEVRDTEVKWTFRINTEKINSYEDRLRALERDLDLHRRANDDAKRR